MSAQPSFARRGLVATALARAQDWLLEPAEEPAGPAEPLLRPRPVIAVFGLAEGCGATTVARALGAELAARDPGGAACVSASSRSAALPLGSSAAARLARTLGSIQGAWTQAAGRLCLADCGDLGRLADAARYLAPLVLDAGRTAVGGAHAAIADQVVLVAAPRVEPALVSVAVASLTGAAFEPLVVLSRAPRAGRFEGLADCVLPDSRMGARFAQAGREPRGPLGHAIAELADRCEGARA